VLEGLPNFHVFYLQELHKVPTVKNREKSPKAPCTEEKSNNFEIYLEISILLHKACPNQPVYKRPMD
jgi:hypothetical protein